MHTRRKAARALIFATALLASAAAQPLCRAEARDGIGGFDGAGISAGEIAGKTTLEYQEFTFVTGEPVLLKGTLAITKTVKDDKATHAFSFKLNNAARKFQLTRDITFETVSYAKANGQTVTETAYTREPSEKIVTDGNTYTMRSLEFTRTSLIDKKPAVDYYSGNSWYRKRYEVGGGSTTASSGNYLTVEATGEFYGFDQYWGAADVESTEFVIEYTQAASSGAGGAGGGAGGTGGAGGAGGSGAPESWSGTATVQRSQSKITELRYVENEPNAISFRGGFLETRRNDNVLEYTARLPEFTAAGISTDRLKRYSDSLQISTFPSTLRLVSPDLRQIRGHWAEEPDSKLFGLEIFTARPSQFMPEQYVTRAEFASAMVAAAKPVPADPLVRVTNARASSASRRREEPVPIFADVPAAHENFAAIEESFNRGLMTPLSGNEFSPNAGIS
ncbi:MAG: hypothetical protein LBL83_07805, partial [Clostridiales bacterium]|nr:hypothetical protein [Clostridiales bacterium]